jgi:cytochrome c-type biogenesis protein CcmE
VLVDAKTILASEVLAKHDEEYMPPEVAEAVKGIKHVAPKDYQSYGQPKSAQPEVVKPETTTPETKKPEENKPAGQQP